MTPQNRTQPLPNSCRIVTKLAALKTYYEFFTDQFLLFGVKCNQSILFSQVSKSAETAFVVFYSASFNKLLPVLQKLS